MPSRLSLAALCLAAGVGSSIAAPLQAPPPGGATTTDATMSIVNKRQSGSFTLRWKPAIGGSGRELAAYDIEVSNCADIRSATGAPLPRAVGGRLFAMSGPPYAVALAACNCNAAAAVHTAPVLPATLRSAPATAPRGAIFGAPCR